MTLPLRQDPHWPNQKTYWDECLDCGAFVRLQSEHSTNPDGTARPAPRANNSLCTGCGFDRLLNRKDTQA